MALDPTEHAADVATQVEAKFIEAYNIAMNARLTRNAVTMTGVNAETGEPIDPTGVYTVPVRDPDSGEVTGEESKTAENVVYTSIGDLTLSSALSNKVKYKDGTGVRNAIDQGMMLAIAESTMIATRESMALAANLHITYILENMEIDLNIPILGTQFNFIAPAMPAAPSPLIPVGALFNVKNSAVVNGVSTPGVNGGIK